MSGKKENKVKVYGGRYGLSSKNTTPSMIKAVFDFLDSRDVHTNFTIGINDDVTNLSIKYNQNFKLPTKNVEFLIYGYGSDGMVSASKDIMKITGTYTNAYVQGYFQYDSKKSGGLTKSHLRFVPFPPGGFHCPSTEIKKHLVHSPFSVSHSLHSNFLHCLH